MTQTLDQRDTTALARDLETVARTKWNLLVTIAADNVNQADAEDAVQAAFLKVWRKPQEWATVRDHVAFMAAVTRYSSLSMKRHIARKVPFLVDFDAAYGDPGGVPPSVLADYQADPAWCEEGDVRAESRRQSVAEALSILSPRERRILELRFLQDMSYPIVAQEVGVNVENARLIGSKAVRKIRAYFGESRPAVPRGRPQVDTERLTESARARAAEVARLRQSERLTHRQLGERMGMSVRMVAYHLANARALGYIS
jgi:RNA polymerase sigma factor (sigma-70 family)